MDQITIDLMREIRILEARVDGLIKPELPPGFELRALFSALNSATDNNVTGDATTYTVICDTEIYDRNGDYNNATGIFTAPISGYYLFVAAVTVADLGAAHTAGLAQIVSSNRVYWSNYVNPAACAYVAGGYYTFQTVRVVDMDAADVAYTTVRVSNGAKTVDVFGAATNPVTCFQGYIIL
jgi:hypothetical protein